MSNLSVGAYSPDFRARTSVIAPPKLISKKIIEELVSSGTKIGDDKSRISMKIEDIDSKFFRAVHEALLIKGNTVAVDSLSKVYLKSETNAAAQVSTVIEKLATRFESL